MTTFSATQPFANGIATASERITSAGHAVPSKAQRITGRLMTGLVTAFLFADGAAKLFLPEPVVKGSLELGYPVHTMVGIGTVLLVATLLYAIPRTAVLGAVLLTGYLGGAIATHVRVENPLFSHILFPTYVAALIWGGLFLRDARLRAFLPWRRPQ
jgi:hypothetical protein